MKSMLLVIVLLVAGIAGLGFYMGWFHLSSGSADNKVNITLSVDKGKIRDDKDKALTQAQDMRQQAEDKTTATTPKPQN